MSEGTIAVVLKKPGVLRLRAFGAVQLTCSQATLLPRTRLLRKSKLTR